MTTMRARQKIRAPRRGLNTDELDFENTWNSLSASFREIHTKNASKLSYEELYRFAYRIVLKKKGEILYTRVREFEREWLTDNVCTGIKGLLTTSLLTSPGPGGASITERRDAGERFLQGLKQAWQDHQLCMNMLADVLMYLDRVYCSDQRQPSIFHSSMELFRDCVLYSETNSQEENLKSVLLVLNSVILEQIQMERDGDVINKAIIKNCVGMLEGLYIDKSDNEDHRLYITSFEPDFLEVSREFYRQEAEQLMVGCDAGAYSRLVTRRIMEEQDRCRSTLSESTTSKIEKIVEEELIKNRIQSLIEMDSGVKFMIDNDRLDELGLIFDLNARVDLKKTELTKAVQRRVIEMGNDINRAVLAASQPPAPGQSAVPNQQTIAAIKWVEDVLQLKDKYDTIWKRAFNQDQALQTALTRSFADFINSSTFSRGSEYISLFIDDNMKKGIKDKTEAQVDEVLDKAITLLRYVQDKDLFERYYKKHLSRRLLMNKSISIDVEKQMISRMKIELGNNFTTKLEAMFRDMTISQELTQNYKDHVAKLGDADSTRIELKIDVLTSMTWPLDGIGTNDDEAAARPKVVYPAAVERVKRGFEIFYSDKHSGRMLTWQPNMGTADLTVRFQNKQGGKPTRQHEVNVPTYGMIILLLFQDLAGDQSLTFTEIQAMTNIPVNDLKRNLQSLAVATKTRILRKEPMSREINDTDKFSFNENFKSDFRRVKVGVIAANNRAETERERRETEKKNDEQRNYIVEAAIVRIMKQRKTLTHEQLLLETVSQLSSRFKPEIPMIKSRIENLIEREYLERIEDSNPAAYKYLA